MTMKVAGIFAAKTITSAYGKIARNFMRMHCVGLYGGRRNKSKESKP
jgi:hypothetical protein